MPRTLMVWGIFTLWYKNIEIFMDICPLLFYYGNKYLLKRERHRYKNERRKQDCLLYTMWK